ncbi:hypothetical protein [[Leptolyngbya] sp. PCC 7376]|uniref:hypothetical protein n=1 Tax=[Leptolyngbya] sp. PCC 7376 TaxID=111781 RepID=UPI0002DDF850|nr:hypothetical protein [[Leptolyngbya] sp. PCC 7376]
MKLTANDILNPPSHVQLIQEAQPTQNTAQTDSELEQVLNKSRNVINALQRLLEEKNIDLETELTSEDFARFQNDIRAIKSESLGDYTDCFFDYKTGETTSKRDDGTVSKC